MANVSAATEGASQKQMKRAMAEGIVKPNNPDSPRREGAGPVYEGNVRRPLAETSMEWRRKLEEMDARTKKEDAELKQKQTENRQLLQAGLCRQLEEQQDKKKQRHAEREKEKQAANRANRRLLDDIQTEKLDKEKRRVELQQFYQDTQHALNHSAEDSRCEKKREGRRRRDSLARHIEDDEREARKRKVQSQRNTDTIRRQELLEQAEEKKAREQAAKIEDIYLARQMALNDVHWAHLEEQHKAKRKMAAEAVHLKQERAAKQILQETLASKNNLMQDRVDNPRDPFTGEIPQMSPRTRRETHHSYRSELDRQVDLKRKLMAEEEDIEKHKTKSSNTMSSARGTTSRLW